LNPGLSIFSELAPPSTERISPLRLHAAQRNFGTSEWGDFVSVFQNLKSPVPGAVKRLIGLLSGLAKTPPHLTDTFAPFEAVFF
jgi:hypothetical protein